jgi:hypothetical protein
MMDTLYGTIQIIGPDGRVKAEAAGENEVRLIYRAPYTEGDEIRAFAAAPALVVLQAEDSIPPVFGWLAGLFRLVVPFGEKHSCWSPKNFYGPVHLLSLRAALPEEVRQYRNLAFNPLDSHENQGFFPHASANVETRGEAQFAARNAINGNRTSAGHGFWPLESWGINRREDAELRIDVGRKVRIDKLVFTLRADFPHDNWWKEALVRFSEGTEFRPRFVKTGRPQEFPLPSPVSAEWLVLGDLKKDETDPSPFPALTQIEAFGWEAPGQE